MRTLWLIRHAKSSWKDLNEKDFDRPLNGRGKTDAPFMGSILLEDKDVPDIIISSPAKRAITTAKLMARKMKYAESKIDQKHLIYDASLQDLLELIYKLDDKFEKVIVIGHNPGLTVLSDYLTDYYIDNIPTCGIVKISFEFDSWKEVLKGSGTFEYFKYPKKYLQD